MPPRLSPNLRLLPHPRHRGLTPLSHLSNTLLPSTSYLPNGFSHPRPFLHRRPIMTHLLTHTSTALTTISHHLPTPTPWYLLLPLTAILIRTTTTLPLTLYSRFISDKVIQLTPLLSAWQRTIFSTPSPTQSIVPEEWEKQNRKMVKERRKEVLRRHGCQDWKKWVGLGQVPIWVLATLTIRAMGVPRSEDVEMDGAEGGGGAEPSMIQKWLDAVPMEESFAEGGALWFVDLLEPDPMYILPMGLSLVMFANIELSALQFPRTDSKSRIIKNIMRLFSLAVIPITMQTPTVSPDFFNPYPYFPSLPFLVPDMLYTKTTVRKS